MALFVKKNSIIIQKEIKQNLNREKLFQQKNLFEARYQGEKATKKAKLKYTFNFFFKTNVLN